VNQSVWRKLSYPFVFLSLAAVLAFVSLDYWQPAEAQSRAAQQTAPKSHAQALSQAFRDASEASIPTVVKITTRSKPPTAVRGRSRGENPFRGTPFEDFFNENGDRLFDRMPSPRSGVGSGVIIDSAGIILTNNHVVDGADEVIVRLNDGREFKSTDIKVDDRTDLAVIRIDGAGKLPAARLGDSDKLEIGDWVIAVGNPFELEATVSAGIISGKGRSLGSVERAKFLQTDAAINPGNSGGPLVNLDGEVVGINTAIASNSGGYQGIGFAVPINTAKWVTGQLIERGSVTRAYLGVQISDIEPADAEKIGLRRGQGVMVRQVMPDTPADDAGLQEGDVVTAFAGRKVTGPQELQEMVERAPLDSRQPLEVLRGGEKMTMHVVVQALPSSEQLAARARRDRDNGSDPSSYESRVYGFAVTEMTNDVAEQLGYSDDSGVLVSNVERGGAAHEKGLREGMLIMQVGRQKVANVEEFKAALEANADKDGLLLHVRTESGTRFLVLKAS
jgi:serine protease Do